MSEFRDFGELYRAAFAECDPQKKSHLLKQVHQALLEWEQEGARSASARSGMTTVTSGDVAVWLEPA